MRHLVNNSRTSIGKEVANNFSIYTPFITPKSWCTIANTVCVSCRSGTVRIVNGVVTECEILYVSNLHIRDCTRLNTNRAVGKKSSRIVVGKRIALVNRTVCAICSRTIGAITYKRIIGNSAVFAISIEPHRSALCKDRVLNQRILAVNHNHAGAWLIVGWLMVPFPALKRRVLSNVNRFHSKASHRTTHRKSTMTLRNLGSSRCWIRPQVVGYLILSTNVITFSVVIRHL